MPLSTNDFVLTVDVGGSHIKAALLNVNGELASDHERLTTPSPPSPKNVMTCVDHLVNKFGNFTVMSVGFPGRVREGMVQTAPNLGTELWEGVDLQGLLRDHFGKPVRVVNDADLLGLGIARGEGLELVVTLGTGFGTALLMDGKLLPHFEIAHHPVRDNQDYDAFLGEAVRKALSPKAWNERVLYAIDVLQRVVSYDTLYLGGGNARLVDVPLPDNVHLSNNKAGLKGGARLWDDFDGSTSVQEVASDNFNPFRMLDETSD